MIVAFCVFRAAAEDDLSVEDEASSDTPTVDGEEGQAVLDAVEAAQKIKDGEGDGGAATLESAKELQEKLAQLRALLDKKGDAVDPALKERLNGLSSQLSSLGLGDGTEETNPALREFLGGCIVMSVRKAGARRMSTLSSLEKLADPSTTLEQAAEDELGRMAGCCVNELTDDELSQFKSGRLQALPNAIAAKAAKPESRDEVLKIEPPIWAAMKEMAKAVQESMKGDVTDNSPPIWQGVVAGIPVLGMVLAMAYKFKEMQKRDEEKKTKSAKKEAKKSR